MKIKTLIVAAFGFMLMQSCKNDKRYIDLATGNRVEIQKDNKTGYMVNAETGKPVDIYVDTKTEDTLYGRTGAVINGKVKQNGEKFEYEDNSFTYKDGDYKLKVEKDYKEKDDDYKRKVEKDGDIKIKDGDTKIKIDGETGKKTIKRD